VASVLVDTNILVDLYTRDVNWEDRSAAALASAADAAPLVINKTSPLPDFYTGAQAAVEGMTILTRNSQRYATYFPTVKLLVP
jgi:predicted nucleic acid-binding protein